MNISFFLKYSQASFSAAASELILICHTDHNSTAVTAQTLTDPNEKMTIHVVVFYCLPCLNIYILTTKSNYHRLMSIGG